MKRNSFITFLAFLLLLCALSTSAFAIDESEVESAIAASGKDAVAGNVFIWFLCAISFLMVRSSHVSGERDWSISRRTASSLQQAATRWTTVKRRSPSWHSGHSSGCVIMCWTFAQVSLQQFCHSPLPTRIMTCFQAVGGIYHLSTLRAHSYQTRLFG